MNKKVVLSVLSTAVVASMATAAFAKPATGLYIGGSVDKYYSITQFLNNEDQVIDEINNTGFPNVLYVDDQGNAATIGQVVNADDLNDVLKKATLEDFQGNTYAKADGTTYDPSKDSDLTGAPAGDLKVESVSAINASQIEVKFGAEVDKESAEDLANYTVSAAGVDKVAAKLVDSKTVVLTLDPTDVVTAGLNQSTVEVSVADVKSAADDSKAIESFTGKVSFLDLTVPQAVSAKLIGPGKVAVTFNEPVSATSGFLIDGGQYSVTVDTASVDYAAKTVVLNTGTLSQGEHTITVNPDGDKSVKDGAGLFVAKTDVKFTVADDVTAPVLVSATASGQNAVVLTFDEPISGLDAGDVYHTANTEAYRNTAVEEVAGSAKKQWKVTFGNPLPTGTVTINVAKEAIQDNFNNKNASVLSTTVSVVSDSVKPTVTEVKVVNASQVTLAYSEAVVGADLKANYKVTDKDGKTVTGYGISYDAATKKATITFSPALKEGAAYTIAVTGIKDTAVVPNEIDAYTTNITVADKTAPSVAGDGLYDKDTNKIVIFFSEAMNGADLLDKSKYTLATSSVQVELPSTATLAVGPNNSSVNITLPSVVKDANGTDITDAINKVIVGQVRDQAGNKTATVFSEVALDSDAGEIGVVADSAVTVDTKTVQFAVNKPLKTVVASDFKLDSTAVEFAKYENKTLKDGTYGSIVTLQVALPFATDATPAVNTVANPTSVSIYGDKFAGSTTIATSADGVAPAIADKNGDKKLDGKDLAFTFNATGDITDVTVTFSEALKQSTVSVDDFEVPGYTVADLAVNSNEVKLKLSPVVETGTSFKVNFVGNVSDAEDNAYKTAKEITVLAADYAVTSALYVVNNSTNETLDAALQNPTLALDLTTYKHLNTDQRADLGADFLDDAPYTTVDEVQDALDALVPVQALKEINWAAENGDWSGAKVSMFTAAGITGVTDANYNAVKAALENSPNKGQEEKAEVQAIVDEVNGVPAP
ncbi:hypothetical protein EDM59_29850 [Brevibacillus nitrificans]|uniref:SbsA Ig-like domain-containing protein n=1 Tax=Brevibacillus nitrificans TaxID=651560 RepID=A0A3M8CRQ1_9BACL|nr:Ig-like domain-containing protein [Brevibacillus nitrificans]RNB78354.1 hypothetical protein EDM59_29850 [Brevibacillus nitrificans]